jgi:nucleoside-diphosphate-sugar epimerase
MTGAYPVLPPIRWLVVDVRDVAELHVRAMTAPDTGGRRLLAAANGLSLAEIAAILRKAFPNYAHKIPSKTVPGFVVRLAANFDYKLRTMLPDIGVKLTADNAYVTELTGVRFRPAEEAVRAAGQSLIDQSVV